MLLHCLSMLHMATPEGLGLVLACSSPCLPGVLILDACMVMMGRIRRPRNLWRASLPGLPVDSTCSYGLLPLTGGIPRGVRRTLPGIREM